MADFSSWLDGAPSLILGETTGDFSAWLSGAPVLVPISTFSSTLTAITDTGSVPAGTLTSTASGTLTAITDTGSVPAGTLTIKTVLVAIPDTGSVPAGYVSRGLGGILYAIADTGRLPAGRLLRSPVMAIFPLDIAEGATGGPAYDTTVVVSYLGQEQRNCNLLDGRLTFNVSSGVRELDQLVTLVAFFRAHQGRAYAFLFKDWSDYHVEAGFIATGGIGQSVFQLCKQYISDRVETRPITRPIASTAVVMINGTVLTSPANYSIDESTGIVTLTAPLGVGATLTASFDFYIPARFTSDQLNARWNGTGSMLAEAIEIQEVRELPKVQPTIPAADPTSRFPDVLSMQMGGPLFQTILGQGYNGFETTLPTWGQDRLSFKLTASQIPYSQQQAVIAYFRAHKGRSYSWRFKDWTDFDTGGVGQATATLDATHFQLQKSYSLGVVVQRPITCPVVGTLVVTDVSGVPLGGWTCDYNSGIISFSSPPASLPYAQFEFDTPARFDSDRLEIRQDELLSYSLSDLSVTEVTERTSDCPMALASGVVAAWKMDEATGLMRMDSTGRGNNLTDHAGVGLVSGVFNGAAEVDYSRWLDAPSNHDLQTGNWAWTYTGWVKTATGSLARSGKSTMIILKGQPEGGVNSASPVVEEFELFCDGDSFYRLVVAADDRGIAFFDPGFLGVATGGWDHLAFWYDPVAQIITGRCNGVEHSWSTAGFPSGPGYPYTADHPLTFGGAIPQSVPQTVPVAQLDTWLKYNRNLTECELTYLESPASRDYPF